MTVTSFQLRTEIADLQRKLRVLKEEETTETVDDYLVDIYEKLDVIFAVILPIKEDEELQKRLNSLGPTYRG